MKIRLLLGILLSVLTVNFVSAQSKVFREVAGEISSDFRPIIQDNILIGYLSFTKLETVSKDSFSYRISIMDENLNDIGVVNFRENPLVLSGVSFEQDVIVMLYRKETDKSKTDTKSKKITQKDLDNIQDSAFVQFINLEGKIIKTESSKITVERKWVYSKYGNYMNIKVPSMQITNLPQMGFLVLTLEKDRQNFIAYNPKGERVWTKQPPKGFDSYGIVAGSKYFYVLGYKGPLSNKGTKGNYEVHTYSSNDGKNLDKYELKDKEGSFFNVLNFQIDKSSGNAVLSGTIHKGSDRMMSPGRELKKYYKGAFVVNFSGSSKSETKPVFSYWSQGQNPEISEDGKLIKANKYISIQQSMSDFEGNRYFAGVLIKKKFKPGLIVAAIPLAVIAPYIVPFLNYVQLSSDQVTILKLNQKGVLENVANIDARKFVYSKLTASTITGSAYMLFNVYNPTSKTSYLVISDADNCYLYNLKEGKVTRKIPRKNGDSRLTVLPGKEGSIMISEINSKEKYSKLSIEPVQ